MQALTDLQPTSWDHYVGQERMKERLDIHIKAALIEERPLPHVLLAGPPGFGKTAIARLIASQLGDPLSEITMPVKPATMHTFLRQMRSGILLVDEIHRAPKSLQEDFLTLLTDGWMQGTNGRRTYVTWLTIIAATTEPEKITPALHDRFKIRPELDAYTPDEMTEIAGLMCDHAALNISYEAVEVLAQAAGGVPRYVEDLVFLARDLSLSQELNPETVLRIAQVDPNGLTRTHVDYLKVLRQLGGTAGEKLLCGMLRRHPTIVVQAERLLIERDLITRTERGRELTETGWAYGQSTASPRQRRTLT